MREAEALARLGLDPKPAPEPPPDPLREAVLAAQRPGIDAASEALARRPARQRQPYTDPIRAGAAAAFRSKQARRADPGPPPTPARR